ncbi:MAG TPA: mechanosensitive ion channel domain-containing protein [Actinomycetota bacterium]|nr:mechanosensitive ion channel domain-containing protein [Actinomycetota bacterium]
MIDPRLEISIGVVAVGTVIFLSSGVAVGRFLNDRIAQYHARKLVRYTVGALSLIALATTWHAFAGRAAEILGFATAGIAFAMQEVIGALAGWFNIVSGRIFEIGDRIEMGGVRGDVIDITLLRTKVMEIGDPADVDAWVKGRQPTGRIVAISNKATFTNPVYNFSAMFDFVWEEITIPVAYRSDYTVAEEILLDEARRVSSTEAADQAIQRVARRHPVPKADVQPRVFVQATSNYAQLSVRFVIPVRASRAVQDAMTRRILARFQEAGVEIGSSTSEVTVFQPPTANGGTNAGANGAADADSGAAPGVTDAVAGAAAAAASDPEAQ